MTRVAGLRPHGEPGTQHGPGPLVGGWALAQLWLFWLAPILGAAAAGGVNRWLSENESR
jgi:aquaporin Z